MRDAGATQTGAEGPEVTGQGGTGEGCVMYIVYGYIVSRTSSLERRETNEVATNIEHGSCTLDTMRRIAEISLLP